MTARSKDHAAFGQAVKALRESKDLTQAQVAKKMNAPSTFISDIERGIRNPSLSTLTGLSKALGVRLADLAKQAGL